MQRIHANYMRSHAIAGLLAGAIVLGGCTTLLTYSPGEPMVASLPISAAGVRDGRQAFANHFAHELALSATPSDQDVSKWIHWPQATKAAESPKAAAPSGISVLVVPGIFGDCVANQSLPFSDGITRNAATNLTAGYAYLKAFGFPRVRAIDVRGRAASSVNGEAIAGAVFKESQDSSVLRIVVIGYSKGVPDTLHALERLKVAGMPHQPLSFVSLSGVVLGTPIADAHEDLYERFAARFEGLECTPSDGGEVASLTRRERTRWLTKHPLPAGVNLYTVVAHAGVESTSVALRPFHRLLARVDPRNDGQVLASDAVLPNSTLLAEAISDHWTYVLPLRNHPSRLVRTAAADLAYPRVEFFRALLRTVVELDELSEEQK